MKKLFLLIMLNLLFMEVHAQTSKEFFQQKKTQKKYLIQQIAALKLYLKAVEKGYNIAKKGLTTIGNIKDRDLNLHTGYFTSLEHVNPEIAGHEKVWEATSLEQAVWKTYERFYAQASDCGVFNEDELAYIDQVYQRLLSDCSNARAALNAITSSGKLEMKDDERLERILALYSEMQDKYTFAQDFGEGALILAASRIQEKNNIQTSRELNSIKQY